MAPSSPSSRVLRSATSSLATRSYSDYDALSRRESPQGKPRIYIVRAPPGSKPTVNLHIEATRATSGRSHNANRSHMSALKERVTVLEDDDQVLEGQVEVVVGRVKVVVGRAEVVEGSWLAVLRRFLLLDFVLWGVGIVCVVWMLGLEKRVGRLEGRAYV